MIGGVFSGAAALFLLQSLRGGRHFSATPITRVLSDLGTKALTSHLDTAMRINTWHHPYMPASLQMPASSGGAAALFTTKSRKLEGMSYIEDACRALSRRESDGSISILDVGADGVSSLDKYADAAASQSAQAVLDGVTEAWKMGALHDNNVLKQTLANQYTDRLAGLMPKPGEVTVNGSAQLVAVEARITPPRQVGEKHTLSMSALSAGDATAILAWCPRDANTLPQYVSPKNMPYAMHSSFIPNPDRTTTIQATLALHERDCTGYLLSILHSDGVSHCMEEKEMLVHVMLGLRAGKTPEMLVRDLAEIVKDRVEEICDFRDEFFDLYHTSRDSSEKVKICEKYAEDLASRARFATSPFLKTRYRAWEEGFRAYTKSLLSGGDPPDKKMAQRAFYNFANPDDCFISIQAHPTSGRPQFS